VAVNVIHFDIVYIVVVPIIILCFSKIKTCRITTGMVAVTHYNEHHLEQKTQLNITSRVMCSNASKPFTLQILTKNNFNKTII
jgi:hypothetical protein